MRALSNVVQSIVAVACGARNTIYSNLRWIRSDLPIGARCLQSSHKHDRFYLINIVSLTRTEHPVASISPNAVIRAL